MSGDLFPAGRARSPRHGRYVQMKLSDLAARLGGTVSGDPGVEISGVGEPEAAGPGMIVYAANARALRAAEAAGPSALLVPEQLEPQRIPAIRVANPRLAFARALALFAPPADHPPGVHATAVLGADVVLDQDVHVGPYVVLGDRVRVGRRTAVLAATVVGADVVIGADCTIYPRVTIREGCILGDRVILHPGVVIGSDGFGYAQGETGPVKIPHLGRVVIEDDVEIGANATVDRGTLGETRIGQATKIDNLVQIAHNVRVGRRVLIAAQVGVSGSVTIGDEAMLGGQAGVAEHVRIGEGAIVFAQAGAAKEVAPREAVSGTPAQRHRVDFRLIALWRRLPELFAAVAALQRRVAELAGSSARDRESGKR